MISIDEVTGEVPPVFLAFWIQHGTEKKTNKMKKKSLNKEPWFVANGCIWLEIKCERKDVRLLRKFLAHFMITHTKVVLGAKAVYIAFKKNRMTQVEINKKQRQKQIHCKYTNNTNLQELRVIENLSPATFLDSTH